MDATAFQRKALCPVKLHGADAASRGFETDQSYIRHVVYKDTTAAEVLEMQSRDLVERRSHRARRSHANPIHDPVSASLQDHGLAGFSHKANPLVCGTRGNRLQQSRTIAIGAPLSFRVGPAADVDVITRS